MKTSTPRPVFKSAWIAIGILSITATASATPPAAVFKVETPAIPTPSAPGWLNEMAVVKANDAIALLRQKPDGTFTVISKQAVLPGEDKAVTFEFPAKNDHPEFSLKIEAKGGLPNEITYSIGDQKNTSGLAMMGSLYYCKHEPVPHKAIGFAQVAEMTREFGCTGWELANSYSSIEAALSVEDAPPEH